MEDQYLIRLSKPDEAEHMFRLMRQVWQEMADKSLFAVDTLSLEWIQKSTTETGIGITAWSGENELAGMLIACFPGMDEENLGWDIGLPEEQLPYVANMEAAAVLSAHRGHHLEQRMIAFAEEYLRRHTEVRYFMATISPENAPSLRSAEHNGYRAVLTKEKYGGWMRHIMLKEA